MKVSIKADIKEFSKSWNKARKVKIPSIIRNTLNDLAMGARADLMDGLNKFVDMPTKFTINSVRFEKTDKEKLESRVGFLSRNFPKKANRSNIGTFPSDYMSLLTKGGTRLPKRKAIAVPTKNYKTNKYGNIKRNDIQKLLNSPKHFSGVSKAGNPGIFKKDKNNFDKLQQEQRDLDESYQQSKRNKKDRDKS